jgi:hypothetical protein
VSLSNAVSDATAGKASATKIEEIKKKEKESID